MIADVGKRIKMFRMRAGLTQSQLGECLDVQKSAIQKYEAGLTDIKISTLFKLSETFKVAPSELLGEHLSTIQLTNALYDEYGATGVELFDLFKGLNEFGRLKVLTYIVDINMNHNKIK